eukprot:gnl/MRDRNA2_/MRDRNA2_73823_c1_seq1.p1 gnl/MRDRNA2_/MRDRNA2_73823_c1~~gnl/MRDRNA2_/MRDRNA2_73823_c1_seq1.p1  ORF type:complete len:181 (+),score=22.37 gnl/MRDRNA2_/MRDRNA2_73823_c1_seq1:61-603(+)
MLMITSTNKFSKTESIVNVPKYNYMQHFFGHNPKMMSICKASKVVGIIKLALDAGKANPSPPVGPALGAKGVNIMSFCKEYNALTAEKMGSVIPVEISVFEDKSFSLKLKTPPAAFLIKQAAKIAKGSANPKKLFVGELTMEQIEEIAKEKLPDLNCLDLASAVRTILGTCSNMGVKQQL